MSRDFGMDARYSLAQAPISISVVWSPRQQTNICTTIDMLRDQQGISNSQFDSTCLDIARGLYQTGVDSTARQLLFILYQASESPEQQARVIGILLQPDNIPLLRQLLTLPESSELLLRHLPSEMETRLIEIASNPSQNARIHGLMQLLLEIHHAPTLPGNSAEVPIQKEKQAIVPNPPKIPQLEDDKQDPQHIWNSDPFKDNPEPPEGGLSGAIQESNLSQIKAEILSMTPEMAVQKLTAIGDSASGVLRQLIRDPSVRSIAQAALLNIAQPSNEYLRSTAPNNPPINSRSNSVINLSTFDDWLSRPETLPATLRALIQMGPCGQAELMQQLVSI